MKLTPAVAGALLLMSLAACGSAAKPAASHPTSGTTGGGPAVPGGTPDKVGSAAKSAQIAAACSLVTSAEIMTATGVDLGVGKPTAGDPPLNGNSCLWSSDANDVNSEFQIDIMDSSTMKAEDAPTLYGQFTDDPNPSVPQTPLPGVGDKAVLAGMYSYVLKGSSFMTVMIGLHDGSANAAALKSLTTLAAGRL